MSEIETENDVINIGEVLDITMAMEYYEQFNQMLNDHKSIILNIDKLERIDGAGLQLLMALVKEAGRTEVEVKWTGQSDALNRAADIIAVEEYLAIND